MSRERLLRATLIAPLLLAVWMIGDVLETMLKRLPYPYDLEWMEGGVLVHAWRLQHLKQIYVVPDPEFIPMIYPPGYPALVAFLGLFTGLSHSVGRFVSGSATIFACLAIVWFLNRRFRDPIAGFLGAAVYLGTYQRSGSFMDMVRPDALFVALSAWAVVLGLERDPKHHRNAGLLIFLAFTVKHNAALFGFPIALAIWSRGSWRDAARFGAWSAIPALVYLGFMEWWTGGLFLTWILEVPNSHPIVEPRVFPGSIREMANAMPIVLGAGAAWLVLAPARFTPHLNRYLGLAVAIGGVAAGYVFLTDLPRVNGISQPDEGMAVIAYAFFGAACITALVVPMGITAAGRFRHRGLQVMLAIGFAIGNLGIITQADLWQLVLPAFVGFFVVASLLGDRSDRSTAFMYGASIVVTAWGMAALMRGHHGGFTNVYMILHWTMSLAFAVILADTVRSVPGKLGLPLVAIWASAQLFYAASNFGDSHYEPNDEDWRAGDEVVDALIDVEGPVLSPFAPWIPYQAGHEPSWHLISLWDIRHRKGPFADRVQVLSEAVRNHYWGAILESGDRSGVGLGVRQHYREARTFDWPRQVLMPKAGWKQRPRVLWVRPDNHEETR